MKRFLCLLLLATPLSAQQPVQTVVWPTHDPVPSYTIPMAPTKAGDAILGSCVFGAVPTLTDSQGNTFQQVNGDFNGTWLISASKGGPESITVTFQHPAYLHCAAIVELPASATVKDLIPSRAPGTSGAQSLKYNDNTATSCSFTLTTSVPNEFIWAYGDAGGLPNFYASQVTPETGWTLAGETPNQMVQYTTVATPGPVTSCFTQPFLPKNTYATEGIIGLQLGAVQPLQITIPGLATFTFLVNAPSQLPSCSATDPQPCTLKMQFCDPLGNCLVGNSGTFSIMKNAGNGLVTSTTIIVTAIGP